MTVRALTEEAKRLSFDERWQLIEALMEMGRDQDTDVTLTPAQAADLDRRIAEERAGKDDNIPGDKAVAMIRQHQRKRQKQG